MNIGYKLVKNMMPATAEKSPYLGMAIPAGFLKALLKNSRCHNVGSSKYLERRRHSPYAKFRPNRCGYDAALFDHSTCAEFRAGFATRTCLQILFGIFGLYDHVNRLLKANPKKTVYVFLDEILDVEEWERCVNGR